MLLLPSARLLLAPECLPFSSKGSKRRGCHMETPCCNGLNKHSLLTRREALIYSTILSGSLTAAGGWARADDLESAGETPANDLIAGLLERSKANKAKYDKERLDSYYRRNYQEYFNMQRGSIEAGTERGLSKELQAEIMEWIKKNEKR